jgi:hypothetical protein
MDKIMAPALSRAPADRAQMFVAGFATVVAMDTAMEGHLWLCAVNVLIVALNLWESANIRRKAANA